MTARCWCGSIAVEDERDGDTFPCCETAANNPPRAQGGECHAAQEREMEPGTCPTCKRVGVLSRAEVRGGVLMPTEARQIAWAIGRKANWMAAHGPSGWSYKGKRGIAWRKALKRLQEAYGTWLDKADVADRATH